MSDRHDDDTEQEQQIVDKPSQAEGADTDDTADAETGMEQEVMDKPSQAEGDVGDSDAG